MPNPKPTAQAVAPASMDRSCAMVAEVALPVPVTKNFAYRIPPALAGKLQRGCRVVVPFGKRLVTGFVVGFDPVDAPAELKPIRQLVDPEPLLDEHLLELTHWLAERTLCSWGEALRAALPGHAAPRRERLLSLGAPMEVDLFGAADAARDEDRILGAVAEAGELSVTALAKSLGVRVADLDALLRKLVRAKKLKLSERIAGAAGTRPPRIKIVRLAAGPEDVDLASALKRAPVQTRAVEFLREAGGAVPLRDLAAAVAGSRAAVRALVDKGFVAVSDELWEGRAQTPTVHLPEPELTDAQREAVTAIVSAVRAGEHRIFLLHGVTGSGKTEVYLRAIREAHAQGRRSILLVPEITLTPQTVSRLRGRFGGRAAVFHSRLTDAERRRIWHNARSGEYDVVLGPRSAVFTPLEHLGLIVIDEEHDGAYKQEDAPRYRARDAAIERARLAGAVVVLGSATPDLETYARAVAGDYELLRLPERVSSLPLPAVKLVDLRGSQGVFSLELLQAIEQRLERREQVILFLNRRGFSPFVQCVACGGAIRCPECAVSLTYHKADRVLRCHYCDHEAAVPEQCPYCRARRLVFRGAGTQRIEEELRGVFPAARIARLDSDSVRKRDAHETILGSFLEGEIDILLGTQMVAKGLDFPRVTLVGVINADTGLHLPDYRASERTFQVLAQVSGRAGRSELGGEVLIQTRCPDHAALAAARDHDDASFRDAELAQRRAVRYPPFAHLASVLVRGPDLGRVEGAATELRERIAEEILERPAWVVVLGPAPSPIARLRGKHRLRLLIKGERREDVRAVALPAKQPLPGYSDVEVIVDIDPLDML